MYITMIGGKKIRVINLLTGILFFHFIFLNKIYMSHKLVVFVLIIAISLVERSMDLRIGSAEKVLFIYILYNTFSTFIGIAGGYGNIAIRTSTVNIIWPMFYLLLSGEYVSRNQLRKLYKIFINFTLIMCILDIIVMIAGSLNLKNINEIYRRWNLNNVQGMLWGSSLPFFRVDNMYFLAFFIPFIISCFVLYKKDEVDLGVTKKKLLAVSIIALFTGVCSGMGGIWLSIAICTAILFFHFKLYKKYKWIVMGMIAFILLVPLSISSYQNGGIVSYVVDEIDEKMQDDNYGDTGNIRSRQRDAIFNKWSNRPLLGSGIGSPVYYQRVETYEETNDNEESYLVVLYQRGIVGLLLFIAVVCKSIIILKNRRDASFFTYPFMIGMCCFLVSNAFNPYLSNMSTLWILFFPYVLQRNTDHHKKDELVERWAI